MDMRGFSCFCFGLLLREVWWCGQKVKLGYPPLQAAPFEETVQQFSSLRDHAL